MIADALPPKPTVRAVVGILRRDDSFLIAQRPPEKPYSGYWEFPGGKIENETSFNALKRELNEEIGIEVLEASHWFNHIYEYPDKIVCLELWLVSTFSGEPRSKENQPLCWATLEEIKKLNVLAGNWHIIDKISLLRKRVS